MKQFILVAGMDYEFKGVNFRIFCDSRMNRIIRDNTAKEELRFQIFDFRRGEIETTEVSYPSGRTKKKITTKTPFQSLSKSNYDKFIHNGKPHYRFKNGQFGVMSILNIYEAVINVGVNDPHTLFELSIFSHGWMGGPILVNSFDDRTVQIPFVHGFPGVHPSLTTLTVPSTVRDPDDMDARPALDFIPPTMDSVALSDFQDAFAPDGRIWLWGCAFPRVVHRILTKIEKNRAYRSSGLGDDVVFKLTNLRTEEADYLESWLSPVLGPFPNKRRIEVEFKFLKFFVCSANQASYSHQIAKNAAVKTYAAVLGTYSEYDSGRFPLMHVHKGFKRHFKFYKNYLGFNFDPEGRKYGEYLPGLTCPQPTP
jgi:hypothetical protein